MLEKRITEGVKGGGRGRMKETKAKRDRVSCAGEQVRTSIRWREKNEERRKRTGRASEGGR